MIDRRHKKIRYFLAGLIVLLLGASILLAVYPSLSAAFSQRKMSEAITSWKEAGDSSGHQTEEILSQAERYNDHLGKQMFPFEPDPELHEEYLSALSSDDSAVLGELKIDSIDLDLPIYHGTGETVLHKGLGHLEGSALPLGRNGEHTLITGHSGLANAVMFDRLDQLKKGNSFSILIPGKQMDYEIVDLSITEPDQYYDVFQDPDHSLVTLVTCTPYGINTHRLLVTGQLIHTELLENQKSSGELHSQIPSENRDNPGLLWMVGAIVLLASAGTGGLLLWMNRKSRSKKRSEQ